MAPKRKEVAPDTVNFAFGEPRSWFVDVFNAHGVKLHRPHLFVSSPKNVETFDDLGQVKSICVSKVDMHPEIECLDVEVLGIEYQLLPGSYREDKMVSKTEGDMFSRGWQLNMEIQEVTADKLQDAIVVPLKYKAQKVTAEGTEPKAKRKKKDLTAVEPENVASGAGSSSQQALDIKALEKESKKAEGKATGGMEQYSICFPFKYKEFEIPVMQCWLAPDHYICRTLNPLKIKVRTISFAASMNRPSSCAYLMPVKNAGPKKGEPMKLEEVVEDKLKDYHYWIIDGQHSIYAAKSLMDATLQKHSTKLQSVYQYRSARIVVDAKPSVTVAISKIANEEAKALYLKENLSDTLVHLRSQWTFAGRPPRPSHGVKQGSESRSKYDAFLELAETSSSASFMVKQGHMVTYSDDIFQEWIRLIKGLEEGSIEGRKPTAMHFRCLSGLDEENVKKIQAALKANEIVMVKSPKDENMKDMAEYVKLLKQDKIIQDELLVVFKEATKDKDLKSWNQIVQDFNINDHVYKVLLGLCDHWIKGKLAIAKVTPVFPLEARSYINWLVKINKEQICSTIDAPWKIRVVNLHMEGKQFLNRYYQESISTGLCIFDTTEGAASSIKWNACKLCDLLCGIMGITGGTVRAQYVLLAFLSIEDIMHLREALVEVCGWHKLFIGGLSHAQEAPCKGAIQLFSVLVFLSQDECFEGYSDLIADEGPSKLSLDASLLDIECKLVSGLSAVEVLRARKDLLISTCIKNFCMGDLILIDIFSNGYVSEMGLKHKRDIICLVESIEDYRHVDERLLNYAKADVEIRLWAGIPAEQLLDEETQHKEGDLGQSETFFDDIRVSSMKLCVLNLSFSPYAVDGDPLGTPIFPIPIDEKFEINSVVFKVQVSTIQGAGFGLFVYTPIRRGRTILNYGGDKYCIKEWKDLCKINSRAKKYTIIEDPQVDCLEDLVYIVGDVKDGNVAGYINSCYGTELTPNIRFSLVPEIPPWCSTHKPIDYGYICVETLRNIDAGEELVTMYEFD